VQMNACTRCGDPKQAGRDRLRRYLSVDARTATGRWLLTDCIAGKRDRFRCRFEIGSRDLHNDYRKLQAAASSAIARCNDSPPFGIASSWPAPSTTSKRLGAFASA
jgi:hypothetical protein